jgi:hypothetical protein
VRERGTVYQSRDTGVPPYLSRWNRASVRPAVLQAERLRAALALERQKVELPTPCGFRREGGWRNVRVLTNVLYIWRDLGKVRRAGEKHRLGRVREGVATHRGVHSVRRAPGAPFSRAFPRRETDEVTEQPLF